MGFLAGLALMFYIKPESFGCGDIFAELDGLRYFVNYGVRHQNYASHDKAADDFFALAVNCRLKIFEVIRLNKNINHPAKNVISATDVLMTKIDKFKKRK